MEQLAVTFTKKSIAVQIGIARIIYDHLKLPVTVFATKNSDKDAVFDSITTPDGKTYRFKRSARGIFVLGEAAQSTFSRPEDFTFFAPRFSTVYSPNGLDLAPSPALAAAFIGGDSVPS